MKIVIKYLWSIFFIPFLIFLKGDFSVDTYMNFNQIEPLAKTREKMMNNIKPVAKPCLFVKVKAISTKGGFNAHGLTANLYDSNYNLVSTSQIVQGKIQFNLEHGSDTLQQFRVVVPSTADEMEFIKGNDYPLLTVYEDHLVDNKTLATPNLPSKN